MVGPATPEKRLLWHPRQNNKFVVGGGSQMTLYEWAPGNPEIKHVTSQHDLQFMKCFAWSPDPAFDDLFAIGLTTGRVDLLRLEATKYARNNVLSKGPAVSLPVRNSRPCNALAFCEADPNYLAVGLDKVRGDSSLVIWDISNSTPALSLPTPQTTSSSVVLPSLAVPDSNGVSPLFPRIPKTDVAPRTDSRVLQQLAGAEVVSAVAFLPHSTNLLLAGTSARWLRFYDLRDSTPVKAHIASRVHGIATDPLNPHQIASYGDGIVSVWDVRKFPHPLLTFTEKDAGADGGARRSTGTVHQIEFSRHRSGTLAVLERDASYVRFWDLKHARPVEGSGSSDGERSRDSSTSRMVRRSWANLPWSAAGYGGGGRQSVSESHESSTVVLSDTRKTKYFSRPLASFSLVPSPQTHALTSNVMVINRDGDLELYAVHDTPKQIAWSSRGELLIGAGLSCKVIAGSHETEAPPEPWDIPVATQRQFGFSGETGTLSEAPLNEESSFRGRTLRATFGRGDEDGFPALITGSNKISSSRPIKTRTYSPASIRRYQLEAGTAGDGNELKPASRAAGPGDQRLITNGEVALSKDGEGMRAKNHRVHGDKSTSKARKMSSRNVQHIIEDDISMTMRRRTIRGYGIANSHHNFTVTREDSLMDATLSDLWAWMNHSRDILSTPTSRLHGYEFSHQGLLGIWEGFPPVPQHQVSVSAPTFTSFHTSPSRLGLENSQSSLLSVLTGLSEKQTYGSEIVVQSDFQSAIADLCTRREIDKTSWKPTVSTNKLEQRQLALQLCGWSLREEDLALAIKRWEKDGKHSRAACWLVFTHSYEIRVRAYELHHMMSGTLAALVPQKSGSSNLNTALRDYCERLIVRLQDPYFRALLTQLTSKDWSEVLEEEALPLRERLAVAFQFLDDKALSSYLRRVADRCCMQGDIEGLIVTGLTSSGMDILQNYVDRTGDVQTAAILSSFVCPSKFQDTRTLRWLEAYRDLLDGFKLFHFRVTFDIERGQILQEAVRSGDLAPFDWAPRQIVIRCNYCSKPLDPSLANPKSRPMACPNCNRALPRCSICLTTLSIVPDAVRDQELSQSQSYFTDTIDEAIIICQNCRHGGHASHILEWFFGEEGIRSHGVCPVADCDCRCGEEL
ncbi:hypothetical protein SERLADRAFT_415303 [Serpula lacrymans var. lacrymans S7.9]|uniref:Uncharacterized protein n=1 Tax=Serpula lacrymans var. lacrymans (strain S7.9) TaxID=578457 RepID=F8NUS2_SERL9|nr:uncharacterized protein SERLADRAFT_415303 [Serpula lacrymans var. lacrymans S7.9]EGO25930.1 hypothetical protein SERLADRAFT_415303 [Serpula lacrymans var. lacrymans S7.9]